MDTLVAVAVLTLLRASVRRRSRWADYVRTSGRSPDFPIVSLGVTDAMTEYVLVALHGPRLTPRGMVTQLLRGRLATWLRFRRASGRSTYLATSRHCGAYILARSCISGSRSPEGN